MKCSGCDAQVEAGTGYWISLSEYYDKRTPITEDQGFDGQFCSWYCASSIINELAEKERKAEARPSCNRCGHEQQDEEYETWCRPNKSHDYSEAGAR